jgi:methionyl-tRNA formyltransferase
MKQTDLWQKPRRIFVVVDNDSWILPFARELVRLCVQGGDYAALCRTNDKVQEGVVAFYLGCIHITPPDVIARNRYNLIVHESDLPKGRGFAPMTWQILEGKDEIPICLIGAAAEVDTGCIMIRDVIRLEGHELCGEWRLLQGRKTIELCLRFLNAPAPPEGQRQKGSPSTYRRRRPQDSRLDPEKTIAEQFNLLRVVDNDRYPAFFDYKGHRYKVLIEKDEV